jgi:hypothetical protein
MRRETDLLECFHIALYVAIGPHNEKNHISISTHSQPARLRRNTTVSYFRFAWELRRYDISFIFGEMREKWIYAYISDAGGLSLRESLKAFVSSAQAAFTSGSAF